MPNPNGNPGNKGGGRKNAYEEKKDVEWASNVWVLDQDKDVLETKIASGKFSVRDMFLYKCLTGNERMIQTLANKLLPDQVDVTSGGSPVRIINVIRKSNGESNDNGTTSEAV